MATHQIVSMTLGKTQGSGSNMWRCITSDGERVNVFQHNDPRKDSFHLFGEYFKELTDLVDGQEITWKEHPIWVNMRKDGQWWAVVSVGKRPHDAKPDAMYIPDHKLFKATAQDWAKAILAQDDVCFFDTETTGVSPDDEITSIAIVNQFGEPIFSTLIHPTNLSRLETRIGIEVAQKTGITDEMLKDAPTFPEIYPALRIALSGCIWVAYNAPFDTKMLQQDCERHKLPPIASIGVNCAMENYAMYLGEWNHTYKRYQSQKLEVACEQMGIDLVNAHNAQADILATLELVKAMRQSVSIPESA